VTTHPTSSNWTAQNVWHFSSSQTTQGITFARLNSANAVTGLFVYGSGQGIYVNEATSGDPAGYLYPSCSDWEACWSGGAGILIQASSAYADIPVPFALTTFSAWANNTYGLYLNGYALLGVSFNTGKIFNNVTSGVYSVNLSALDMNLRDVDIANIAGMARQQPYAFSTQNAATQLRQKLQLFNVNIGTGTGFTTHTTGITYHASAATNCIWEVTQRGGAIGDSISGLWTKHVSAGAYSTLSSWKASGLGGTDVHFVNRPIQGIAAWEGTVFRTTAPAMKMTPLSATYKLQSGDKHIPLVNGAAAKTITVYIRKDATYNGSAPRLLLRRNDAIGVTADAVIATASLVAADTWYSVSGSLPVATLDGVVEVYVDCDGTAGNIYVDDWSIT
jgi:hypothetical protein